MNLKNYLTLLLLFFFAINISAQTKEKKITINFSNISLSEAMGRIEKSTGYTFFYDAAQVDIKRKVSLDSKNEFLSKALSKMLNSINLSFEITNTQIAIFNKKTTGLGANIKIHGKIVDETGEGIIGANIIIDDTTTGTITDFDGNFELEVPKNANLVISYIGYKQQKLKVKDENPVTIQMAADAIGLQDVVIIGYGSQRKSDLTGGIVSVSSEKLQMVTTNNLLDKLAGQVPGLKITTSNARPGEDQSIRVRGENSLSANNAPLIILDGIPYSGSLTDINPDIIENLSVLKDASSAAIYGSRGSNGVILIQTKKGKEGAPTVTYKGQIGLQQVQKRLNVMKGDEYVRMKQDYNAIKYGYIGDQLDPINLLNPNERINYENGSETDWQDIMFRNALTHDNQVSISGGTEATKYMAAIAHMSQDGVMQNTGLKRTNISLNITQELGSWLTIGIGTQVIQKDINNNQPHLEAGLKQSPYGQYKDEDDNYVDYPMNETLFSNPMANINATTDKVHRNVFISTFAEVKLPIKGLSYRTNLGYNYRSKSEGSYYGRNTLSGRASEGSAKVFNEHYYDYTWENLLKYNQTFGKHKIDATGLFSMQQTQRKEFEQKAECFVNDDSEYHNMNAGEKNQSVTSKLTETATLSYMLRLNYGYDNRYLLTLTGRTDGYSAFGANNKYAFFPSAAVAWNLSSESFMEKARETWLDMLKIRLSYGSNGNQAINAYQTLDRLNIAKYIWGDGGTTANGTFLPFGGVGNPNLKWETTRTFNFGIDFGFFNNRISGNIEIYVANTSDLLMNRTVPVMNGFNNIIDNIGETRNKGIEIGLNTINIENKNFRWNTSVNFSLNRDKIIELRGDGKDDVTNKWFIGEPLRVYYDYNVVGVWQANDSRWNADQKKFLNEEGKEIQSGAQPGSAMLEDVNGDGKISSQDKKVIGSKLPNFLLSMGNQFSYKNFSLSFLFDGVFGMVKERKDLNIERWNVTYNYLSGMNYWTPGNPSNEVTSLIYSPYDKHSWYKKINYVQVKNITLGYNFKKEWLKNLGVSAVNVNASVNNLRSFSNVDNTTNLDADDMYSSYPTNRSYMFGLNLTF